MERIIQPVIIVKGYIFPDNYIIGTFEKITETEIIYCLDDGDLYSLQRLHELKLQIRKISSDELIEKFKHKFDKNIEGQ